MNKFVFLTMLLVLLPAVFAINPFISPFYVHVNVGETATLTTKVPAGTQVFWQATNPNIVEIVDTSPSFAKVKGLKTGQTAVTFRTNTGRRATAMVYVGKSRDVNQPQRKIGVNKVVVSPQKQIIPLGEIIDFYAAMGRAKDFQWRVEDPNLLQVISASGNRAQVKGIGVGTTHVFATTNDGIVGDSLVTIMPKGRQRNSVGIKYFETGGLHDWQPYSRTGGVTVYKK